MAIYSLDGQAPEIAEGVFVADGARVIGRVRLGAHVGVWFGAVLRGDNEWMEIGADTNIQDNATLHSDAGQPLTIGTGCTVGHGAIVHGCTIGDNTLIGMGATVLNGARIGRNSIVGANALVTEGRVTTGAAAGIRADLNRAYEAVRSPEGYRPQAFRTALGNAVRAVGRLA